MSTDALTLRFLDLSDDAIRGELLLTASNRSTLDDTKLRALHKLNIEPAADERPLSAWLRVMAEENGLPVQRPAHPDLANAAMAPRVARFVWFLA